MYKIGAKVRAVQWQNYFLLQQAWFYIATTFKTFSFNTPPSTMNFHLRFTFFNGIQIHFNWHLYLSMAPHDFFVQWVANLN